MKAGGDPVAHAIPEYRDMTNGDGAGTAARARLLENLDRRRRRQRRAGRLLTVVTLGTVVIGSAAFAAARIARWTSPAAVLLPMGSDDPQPVSLEPRRPRRMIPAVTAPALVAVPDAQVESRLYATAHAAHFVAHDPDQALAAWNIYLQRYPHGSFEPEARFNRAICLVRLRQFEAAATALAPFAAGRFGGYRRAEAQRLLDWLPQPALSAAPAR